MRRPLPRFLSALALLAAGPWAAAAPAVANVPRDPALVPDRIVLNLTATPAESIAVTWRTSGRPARAIVQVAVATTSPADEGTARTLIATSVPVAIDATTTVWHHAAIIPGLAPGQPHTYRVGDGATHWSEWSTFRPARSRPDPFRFLYFGDPQNELKEHCARVFRAAYAKAPDSAFYLIAGDLVTSSIVDEQWGDLFYAAGWLPRELPGMSTPGNHDYGQFIVGGRQRKTASPLFRAHFTQPENGPAGLEETTYHVDYQGVRFVSLNGNERIEDQVAWLDRLLADQPQRWTIVFMHQPVYSTGKNRDNPRLREALVPVYDRHAVDLVLQGHDHSYGRTHRLRAGQRVADDQPGTVYTVSVTGPKFYPINPTHANLMARIDTGRQLFQVVAIDGMRLRYEAWTVTGELHDNFELRKTAPLNAATTEPADR